MGGAHGHAVGVDFGTSTSLVATRAGRRPVQVAPLGHSTRWFPSVAGYRGDKLVVGEEADALPSDQVIRSIKRAITRNEDRVAVFGPAGTLEISADEVMIALLAEIGARATRAGEPLNQDREFRLGCPAMWDGAQRNRLLELAEKAGLPTDGSALVDEPIAAGIAWVSHRYLAYSEQPEGRLLVFDMGGGTLDIAVLDVVGGPHPEISVLTALGAEYAGDMLDHAIARDLYEDLTAKGYDLSGSRHPELLDALVMRAAREAKVNLSRLAEHRVVLPSRQLGAVPVLTYTREQLEEAFRPQMDEAERLVWAALRAARLTERESGSPEQLRALGPAELIRDVDYVLLAGGMSRIPYVGRRVGALFPHAQVFDDAGVQADEAIVAGLADTAGYDRLNLHRPGFDFIVEWDENGQTCQETLYAAHTPFYEAWQVLSGQANLGYERHDHAFPGPKHGRGRLRVRATTGESLGLKFDDQVMDGIGLTFGRSMSFKLYCDGRILLRDGSGKRLDMKVDRWPVMRGRDHAQLVLRSAQRNSPTPPTPWYMEKEWAPPTR
ncbi:Hsp70 family protein [Micromonospora sp. WMMA1947]|uniref:Hsp70 family protein n=1 Tax=Micromonospora sp. WMMA1947 TaxID=3015163 RepID=UPI00248C4E80|nr:Hsp70 family protein [Micromonospora sp. WMMA1947]WBC08355.1 Hsp70 family protein [Micromonospora sp. WMMA1947]